MQRMVKLSYISAVWDKTTYGFKLHKGALQHKYTNKGRTVSKSKG